MKIEPFCTSPQKIYIKDEDKKCHWVVHSKMKPIGVGEFFNIKAIINKLESIINVNEQNTTISCCR